MTKRKLALALLGLAAGLMLAGAASAQSRLKSMPGYSDWADKAGRIPGSVKGGGVLARWDDDSRSFDYILNGDRWRYDVRHKTATDMGPAESPRRTPQAASGSPSETSLVLARGRGADADVRSPDGEWRAFSRDLNMWIAPASGGADRQITTDGSTKDRIRNGTGSYVYLEEFSVRSPVWWSPDSKKVAWFRYDESKVDDYFIELDQTKKFSQMLVEAYPHPGQPNPVADLMVYDVASGKTTRMDVRDGRDFTDDVVGHYVWAAEWSQDSSQLLVRRADRRQKVYELASCDPGKGACRTVVRESRPQSWATGASPTFLKDGKRFIWRSDRTDFANYYLYDLDGHQLAQLTNNPFDVVDIVKVDEKARTLWYTARSGSNYMMIQLHRVKLDGTGDKRLTDPDFTHRVSISPDNRFIVDVAQTHDKPSVTRLLDSEGKFFSEIARADTSEYDAMNLKRSEMFSFTSADGVTPLHGMIDYPSGFDPSRKYPVLLSVYGGPGSNGVSENFATPSPLTEFGFLVVKMDARSASGKGRKILDQIYQQLGVAEMDDFAAGIKSIRTRPYIDANRIGVYGTSYGGTVAATLLLRYGDVFQAASSNSPVTDYRLYDSAYSERYLGLPQTDKAAYDRAAVLSYVDGLKGDLLLYYGTSDDNVHPKNTMQLIKALQAAGKSFEVQVGPDKGHTAVDQQRMMEFFIEKLVLVRP